MGKWIFGNFSSLTLWRRRQSAPRPPLFGRWEQSHRRRGLATIRHYGYGMSEGQTRAAETCAAQPMGRCWAGMWTGDVQL